MQKDTTSKLIKPKNINDILTNENHILLTSRKKYLELHIKYRNIHLHKMCSVRDASDMSDCYVYANQRVLCMDISNCDKCFLKANNCLNIFKYVKKNNLKVNKL